MTITMETPSEMNYLQHLTPTPGSADEIAQFHQLQMKMPGMFERVSKNRQSEHTSVIIPSMTLNQEELLKLKGAIYYEERLLYLLMLLRRPRTRLIFVTSKQIHQSIVDYYLHLLTGVPASHARKRLILLDTNDNSNLPLSQKILERPMLMHRIRSAIRDQENSHLVTFNTTPLERTLSVQLGIPLYGLDPQLLDLGSKSGCREIFREAEIPMPMGFERLRKTSEIVDALSELWDMRPEIKRAVVKLNEGFSGEGNAIFDYRDILPARSLNSSERKRIIEDKLVTGLKYEAESETWENFAHKFYTMGGIVEEFIEGDLKRSPSVQCRVNAIGEPQVISTHDQLLGGPSGQVYLGCTFPADSSYRMMIQDYGDKIARVLAEKRVIGRFAVDFVVVKKGNEWECFAIEINLRKGGTTHPFLMMKFLTDGHYDRESGLFLTSSGHPRYYLASDNLTAPNYRGVSPDDLIDIAVYHDLHFHSASERGVVFHLIGAMSQYGKLGVTCIGKSPKDAQKLYDDILSVLDAETTGGWTERHESLKNVMF